MPDHRTEVLGLELACADYLAEVPWVLVERGGDICHELEEVGREYSADAIVVGSTHGLVGKIFGSVAAGWPAARSGRSWSSRSPEAAPDPVASTRLWKTPHGPFPAAPGPVPVRTRKAPRSPTAGPRLRHVTIRR